jgi:hypothetical protein
MIGGNFCVGDDAADASPRVAITSSVTLDPVRAILSNSLSSIAVTSE